MKINFKPSKLNYEKWLVNIVSDFQSHIFKNLNIINFKHKKSKYFQFFQKSLKNEIISIIKIYNSKN